MDFVEKQKVSPPPAKSHPLDSSAIKSSEKSVEKKVETQKEPIEQKLDWKNSLKSFELQEQATLEGQFKNKIKKP